jgi:signal transduction histidine kinase
MFTFIEYIRHRESVLANLSLLAAQSGQVIEGNLRHEMVESDPEGIQGILNTIGQSEEFKVVYVLDITGEVVYAPAGNDVGVQLDNRQSECQPCHRLAPEARPSSVVVRNSDGQRVFRSMHPIENSPECAECHDPDERLLGVLLTDIPTALVEEPLNADLRENIMWGGGTILVTVIVVNLAIDRFVLRRLGDLLAAITSFGRGRLPSPTSEPDPDEIGQLVRTFNEMARNVEQRRQENVALSERLHHQSAQRGDLLKRLITAQEDERKRVARELHDELGQALGGLALRAEVLERYLATDQEGALEQLGEIRELLMETSDRMYDLILALRPSALDDLGLVPALRTHAERALKDSNTQFEIDVRELRRRLPVAVETALFRTTQEAITNVVRHSGASHLRITLACKNGVFREEIVDNGRGFDPDMVHVNGESGRGLGLLGMQERISQCGGTIEIISVPGSGTKLRIVVPVEEAISE